MSDREAEIYKVHRQGQDKFTYFVLAGAATAIGYALTQTNGATLTWASLPLGAALAGWGASFLCGCQHLRLVDAFMHNNAELLRIQAGNHPEVGPDPEMIAAAAEGSRQGLAKASARSARLARWQYRLLLAGAGFYIGWRILEMYFKGSLGPCR